MGDTVSLGVSIPTYSNVESLRRCLESIAQYAPSVANNIIVVDDSGTSRIAGELRERFPTVHWIVHSENQGFGASANEAVLANRADIVILLNDDVELLSNPVPPLTQAFRSPRLFAVTFQSLDETSQFREGAKRLVWNFGFPRILHNESDQSEPVNDIQHSSYAVGGHAAYHRARFQELGGFDALFAPFYWEDVDLSVRAADRGWDCIYLPECTVRHAGAGSIRSREKAERVREITQRNRILFAYRHASRWQRCLLGASLAWQRLVARVGGDSVWLKAHRAAEERWKERAALSLRDESTAPATGASIGD